MTDQPSEDQYAAIVDDEARAQRHEEVLADTVDELQARADASSVEPVITGHDGVDEVLQTLNSLDGVPVDEHVAVFEQAHEQLRRTLSGAGDDRG
ncbi:MAG: hypothetical protein JWQ74_397 [Marmoricola sp.]|nr:hypothetical protein [Marmoricola sp.]